MEIMSKEFRQGKEEFSADFNNPINFCTVGNINQVIMRDDKQTLLNFLYHIQDSSYM